MTRNNHNRAPTIEYEYENNAVFALTFNDLIYLITKHNLRIQKELINI